MKCLIQAGHYNIKSNCDVSLRSSTGAGGEVEINIAVGKRLVELLISNGIEARLVDANFNCDPTSLDTDYDLFMPLHCDMNYANDGGSGFCDYPEPSTDDATEQSQKLARIIQDTFFPLVGITVKSRSNKNTRYHYMWKSISAKTPCVLIEMGQVQDEHDYPILKDTELVARSLCTAILRSLGINVPTCDCVALQEEIDGLRTSRNSWRERYEKLDDESTKEIKAKIQHIEELQKTIAELNNQIAINSGSFDSYAKDVQTLKGELEDSSREIRVLKEVVSELDRENKRLACRLQKFQKKQLNIFKRISLIFKGV